METKQQHGGQRANSGRKPLPETLKKKTSVIRIDAELLPLVEKLKQGLTVTNNQDWQQTSALSEDDIKEQANYIERLATDKAHLSAQVQQFEKQLHKIKIDSDSKQTEIDKLNAMAENCFQCAGWTGDKCSKGLVLTGFCCAEYSSLREELKAAKAKILELLNVETKVFSFTWNNEPRQIRKHLGEWQIKNKGGKFSPVNFINDSIISNDSGQWFIELDNEKIRMEVLND